MLKISDVKVMSSFDLIDFFAKAWGNRDKEVASYNFPLNRRYSNVTLEIHCVFQLGYLCHIIDKRGLCLGTYLIPYCLDGTASSLVTVNEVVDFFRRNPIEERSESNG